MLFSQGTRLHQARCSPCFIRLATPSGNVGVTTRQTSNRRAVLSSDDGSIEGGTRSQHAYGLHLGQLSRAIRCDWCSASPKTEASRRCGHHTTIMHADGSIVSPLIGIDFDVALSSGEAGDIAISPRGHPSHRRCSLSNDAKIEFHLTSFSRLQVSRDIL